MNLISNVWSLDYRDDSEILPFAGGKGRVLAVDSKQKYQQDTYKGKYGQSNAPFGTSEGQRWETSSRAY
jgi:hypothetical protein